MSIGCINHQYNLPAKDLTPAQPPLRVCIIAKGFKFTRFMKGLLQQKEASTSPVAPCEVRWSSTVEMSQWYARNELHTTINCG